MTRKIKRYDPDFKQKIVLLSYGRKSTVKLEKEFGLKRGQLTTWRQKLERSGNGNFPAGHFSKLRLENEKIQELEKKIRHMDQKFQILKAAGHLLNKETELLLSFILNNEKSYSITLMCRVLNLNRSTYHKWRKNQLTKTQMRKRLRQEKIIEAFYGSGELYGANKIAAALQNGGFSISLSTVKRYMAEMGLRSKTRKKRIRSPKSNLL